MASDVSRRAFLATAAVATTGGCITSGSNPPDSTDYTATGTENSDIFTEVWLESYWPLPATGDFRIMMRYRDSRYDNDEHTTYLLDGDEVVDEAGGTLQGDLYFRAPKAALSEPPTYTVITRTPVEVVDEFELRIREEVDDGE
jgi:hypothetical protein